MSAIRPLWAIAGGRITIEGADLVREGSSWPVVSVGEHRARIACASRSALTVTVPAGVGGSRTPVRVEGALGETALVELGRPVATGLHQVDSPVIDASGRLYLTYSGSRGEGSPVSLFRVRPDGFREPFVTGITNPTSMTFGADGLYVSSRFAGTVYRVDEQGEAEPIVSDLGVACGLAFGPDGALYVGDRQGTVFRVELGGRTMSFARLPASVAAFHLAWGPDDALYVTAPTLASRDAVYRIDEQGRAEAVCSSFGRPQGLAFDAQGTLYVVEALAGVSGLYRLDPGGTATCVLSAAGAVGVAFDPGGGLVIVTGDTAYRLDVPLRPLRRHA